MAALKAAVRVAMDLSELNSLLQQPQPVDHDQQARAHVGTRTARASLSEFKEIAKYL